MGNQLTKAGSFLALAFGTATFLFICLYLLVESYPALTDEDGILAFLFEKPWAPLASPPVLGIFHAWLSTLYITLISLLLAVPIGFGIGLFVSELSPPWMRSALQPCLDLLAGIPSVVYGFFGYVTLLPWFERNFEMATGESVLATGLILAIMVLPYIASVSAESFRAVAFELKEAGLAHGVSQWYMIRKVVIVQAMPGMFTAVALGLARAIGETLAVLMLAGNSVAPPHSLLDRGQPLTALIATELGEAGVASAKYHALFAAGLVLLILSVGINTLVWFLKKRMAADAR